MGSVMDGFPEVFTGRSTMAAPQLEFLFEVRLQFTRVQMLQGLPSGFSRGAVYLDGGTVQGPRLNGQALGGTGADWSMFRPDGVLSFDARYMLQADDGALILVHNKGYLWGRRPDVMPRIREWIFHNGPEVPHDEYYLRAFPTFEVETGPYDWLMRHVVLGIGERKGDGNLIRYYAVL